MKNIWIINHYINNVKNNEKAACRHRYFANELEKRGYNVTLIYSSQEHNSDYNSIEDNSPYKIIKEEKENNVAIKTRPYKGNGKSRVLNMLDFYFGCLKQYKKIVKETTKPDIIIASSVHPLACVAGIKIAKKLNIKCICEIRDLWPLSIVEYKNMSGNNPIIKALYVLEKWI
ncbi:MAG: glycosyltransferase, partial [Clostridia bacterium]